MEEKIIKKVTENNEDARFRVSVFRSNRAISAQIVSPEGKSLGCATTRSIKEKKTPVEKAFITGESLAKIIKAKSIQKIFFDRGKYRYHGQVKALAEGLRKEGINF